MKRRFFTFLTALSLLLFVALCVMWVRSYWRADCFTFWDTRGQLTAESRAGYLAFGKSNLYGDSAGPTTSRTRSARATSNSATCAPRRSIACSDSSTAGTFAPGPPPV